MVVDAGAGPRDDLLVPSSQSDRPEVGLEAQSELIPDGISADLALELIASQPLQDMAFVGEQMKSRTPEMDSLMLESQQGETVESEMGENNLDQRREHEEEFPSLSLDNLRLARERERNMGGGERRVRMGKEGMNVKVNKWSGGKNFKESLAVGAPRRKTSQRALNQGRLERWG